MTYPLVALSATSVPSGDVGRPARVRVNEAYVHALRAAGLVPLIVPPSLRPDEARAIVAGVAGVVLSGGEDLDPATYGALRHPATQASHAGRDATEFALVAAARDARRPVLAICRGIQLVNVALGGTLVQDLPSERPGPVDHVRDDARDVRVHGITVQPGSRLAGALQVTALDANSMHHQAVDRLAAPLRATAFAPDGVIEGVETVTDDWWLLAVQWHPEEMTDDPHPWDRGIFAAFARACGRT
jgi:putative glutamine amidotransferase